MAFCDRDEPERAETERWKGGRGLEPVRGRSGGGDGVALAAVGEGVERSCRTRDEGRVVGEGTGRAEEEVDAVEEARLRGGGRCPGIRGLVDAEAAMGAEAGTGAGASGTAETLDGSSFGRGSSPFSISVSVPRLLLLSLSTTAPAAPPPATAPPNLGLVAAHLSALGLLGFFAISCPSAEG